MTLHIQKFIDRLQSVESKGSKDFVMPLADAKNLHTDITRLLLELQDLRQNRDNPGANDIITINLDGGKF